MNRCLFRVRGVNSLSCNNTIISIFQYYDNDIVVSKSRYIEIKRSNSNVFSTFIESKDGDFVAGSLSGDMLVCITNNRVLYLFDIKNHELNCILFDASNSQIKYLCLNGNDLLLVSTENDIFYYNVMLKYPPISWRLESSVVYVNCYSDCFVVVDASGTFFFYKYDGNRNSISCIDRKYSGISCSSCYICDMPCYSSYCAGNDYCYLYSDVNKTISVLNMNSFVVEYSIPCVEHNSSFHGMCCIEDRFCYIQDYTLYFYSLVSFENIGNQVFNVGIPISFISSYQNQLLLGTEVGDLFWLIHNPLPYNSRGSINSSGYAPGTESLKKPSTFPCLLASTEELKRKALRYIRPGKSGITNQSIEEEVLLANHMMSFALFDDDQMNSNLNINKNTIEDSKLKKNDQPTAIVNGELTRLDSNNTTGESTVINVKPDNISNVKDSGSSKPIPPEHDSIKNKGNTSPRKLPLPSIIRKHNPDGTTTNIRNNQNSYSIKGKVQSNQQPNWTQTNDSLSNTVYPSSPTITTIVKRQSIVRPPPKPILIQSTQSSLRQPNPISIRPSLMQPTRIQPHPISNQPTQSKSIQPTQPKPSQPTQSIVYPPFLPLPTHSSPIISTSSQSTLSPLSKPIPSRPQVNSMVPVKLCLSPQLRSIDSVSVNTRIDHERQNVKKPDLFTASLFHINRSFNSSDLHKGSSFSITSDYYDSSQYPMKNIPPQIEELVIQTKQRISQITIPSRSNTEKRKRLSETRRAVFIRLCQGIVNKKDISYIIRMICKLVGKDVQQLFACNRKKCIVFIMTYFQCINLEFERIDDILGNEPD